MKPRRSPLGVIQTHRKENCLPLAITRLLYGGRWNVLSADRSKSRALPSDHPFASHWGLPSALILMQPRDLMGAEHWNEMSRFRLSGCKYVRPTTTGPGSPEPGRSFFATWVSWSRNQLRQRQRGALGFGPALTPLVQT